MKVQRGFTLIELIVTMSAIGVAGLALATSVNGLHREDAMSRAYCSDVHGMRQTVRMLRSDLRAAGSIRDLDWTLAGDRLLREGREVARNVGTFDVKADGAWATARLVVGARRHLPTGDGAELTVRVRMRNAGRK